MIEVIVDEPKENKKEAEYRDASESILKRCYVCKFFISRGDQTDNRSAKVWGPINRHGVCNNFERR